MSSPPPEIRIDQLTGLRTILAPARAERPLDWDVATAASEESPAAAPGPEAEEAAVDGCPFCEGNESKTPPEKWADRPGGGPADSPGWRCRAVPNLYPALAGEGGGAEATATAPAAPADPLRASSRAAEPDMFSSLPASAG